MSTRRRPILLAMTATAAGMSLAATVGDAASGPAGASPSQPATRMGAAIADDLADRDARERAQARTLDLQEQAAKAAQARLSAALRAKQRADAAPPPGARPAQGGTPGSTDQSDRYEALARIYQTMKPAKAAPVFEQLDLDLQAALVRQMRERPAAMLMAAMTPGGAAKLSMALAGRTGRTTTPPPLSRSDR